MPGNARMLFSAHYDDAGGLDPRGGVEVERMGRIPMGNSYYDLFGLPLDATDAQIHDAYGRLKAEAQGNPALLRLLDEAFRVLANPIKRRAYREQLRQQLAAGSPPAPPSSPAPSSRVTGVSPAPGAGTAPDRPATPPPSSAGKRRPTILFDVGDVGERTVPGAPPTGGRRQPTELFGADSAPATGKPQEPAGAPRKRGPTEVLPLEDGSAAVPPAPRSGRPPTAVMPIGSQPAPSPGAPAQPSVRKTDYAPDPDAASSGAGSGMDLPSDHPLDPGAPGSGPAQNKIVDAYPAPDTQVRDQADVSPAAESGLQGPCVCVSYGGQSATFPLHPGRNVIGRPSSQQTEQPDIRLEDAQHFVSRCHAVITIEETGCTIVDQSKNGTSLNGQRLVSSQIYPLHDGDRIEIEGRELVVQLPHGS